MNTDARLPPFDLDAEASLIGAALIRPSVIGSLAGFVDPSDFYKPHHGHVWTAMLDLHSTGGHVDVVTVHAATQQLDVTVQMLLECQNATPAVSAVGKYADIVVQASRRRKLMQHYSELVDRCYTNSADEVIAMDNIRADALMFRGEGAVDGLMSLPEFIASTKQTREHGRWLIPHIMRPRWRIIMVAGEGMGKGVLMRSLGLHIAAGRDPWNYDNFIEPCRVLYIDVENSDTTILHQVDVSNTGIDFGIECEDRYHLWRREAGLNLRDRRVQAELDAVLQATRPDIVFAGPLYKLTRRRAGEDLEQSTLEMLEVIDDFRVRYNFAIMLEHHAPKGSGGSGFREMNPFGSSVLLRWPEFGITLEPDGNPLPNEQFMTMNVGRFRRDREPADWPDQISRGAMGQRTAWNPRFANGRNRRGL